MKRILCLSLLTAFMLALPTAHLLTAREPHFAVCVTPKFSNLGHIATVATRIGMPPADVQNRTKANTCLIDDANPEDVGGAPCVCP